MYESSFEDEDFLFVINILLFALFLIVPFAWLMSGILWLGIVILNAVGAVAIPVVGPLFWIVNKLVKENSERRKRQVESAKNIRRRAARYLTELLDALPTEFVGARTLVKRMAKDAVELLISRRNQRLHDLRRLVHDTKRYRGAREGSPEAQAGADLRGGVRANYEELANIVARLGGLLCFLDGKAEVVIRDMVSRGCGEDEVVDFLLDYCEQNLIQLVEPPPKDRARLIAMLEVEQALIAGTNEGASSASVPEPNKRRQAAAARSKISS